ncbi:tyrosine-type recombinase/integrase [Dongia sp.]|uniref:tyrosine-type recombinase/integrase n=1 Tax=Dongia sp. TaxID=1977262 RepID=UPI0034A174A3
MELYGRVRGRIEAILDWATARGHRKGDNPARWRGHMENLLPKRAKVKRVQHHPALPYAEIGAFMADLRKQEGLAALALELLILTATRTSEAIAARWDEIDLKAKVWTIPADRIKAGREHRIPLSAPAVAILKSLLDAREKMPDGEPCPWVFPGVRGKSLSNGAILSLLKRMKRADITAHGFRSTFRDWAAEQTAFPRDVAEMALAHAIGDKVEAAYRRGDLFEKRKRLMDAWAGYTAIGPAKGGKVLPLQHKSRAWSPT